MAYIEPMHCNKPNITYLFKEFADASTYMDRRMWYSCTIFLGQWNQCNLHELWM